MSELGFAPTGATVVSDVASGVEVAVFDSGDGPFGACLRAGRLVDLVLR